VDPTLAACWERILEDWSDDERHGKFVGYAQANGLLGEAAGFYRQAMGGPASPYRLNEAQAVDAKKRLGGIAALAIMDLDVTKTERAQPGGIWAIRAAALLILIAAVGLLVWALTRG
jgi:hypothetical protein